MSAATAVRKMMSKMTCKIKARSVLLLIIIIQVCKECLFISLQCECQRKHCHCFLSSSLY